MQITIAHDLITGMAINAVECVFTQDELGNGLVIIIDAPGGMIGPLNEFHLPQIVIAAIVAGVALGIRDRSRKYMNIPGFPTLSNRQRGMAGCTTRKPGISLAFTRWGVDMTGQAVFCKFLDGWIFACGDLECTKLSDPCPGPFIDDGSHTKTGDLVRLRAKCKADVRDGTRVSGLDAGHDALDMVTVIRGIPRMTVTPTAGGFDH